MAHNGPGVTAPLHEEHRHLLPHVDELRETADAVGSHGAADLRTRLVRSLSFLTDHLIPHARSEDTVLYPEIDHLMGNVPATATMRRDHEEVARLTARLADLSRRVGDSVDVATAQELRAVLYGLYAVVALHFAKEEEVYLPLLDERLSAPQAHDLFERLEQAGREVAQ